MPSWVLSGLSFLTAAVHGYEASKVAQGASLRFRSACASAVWSKTTPLAQRGTVLSLLDGRVWCDPGVCIIRNWFRMLS